MDVEHTIRGTRARVSELRAAGKRIAFVPTMGALHAGHLSLVERARADGAAVVASVFVNPLQFGPSEDFARYPRTLQADSALLAGAGAALLFAPAVDEMYPRDAGGGTTVQPGPAGAKYEGAVRPGHFAGVLTVVAKLLNIVRPDVAVFGQKDLQQSAVVRAMARDLDLVVEIVVAPTVREPDGLAMSSRNRYLSPADRARAPRLYAALRAAAGVAAGGDVDAAEREGRRVLAETPEMTVDYLAVVDRDTFERPAHHDANSAVIGAVRLGGTRLLDNVLLEDARAGAVG